MENIAVSLINIQYKIRSIIYIFLFKVLIDVFISLNRRQFVNIITHEIKTENSHYIYYSHSAFKQKSVDFYILRSVGYSTERTHQYFLLKHHS